MLAGRRDPSRRVAIGRGSSRAHFLAIIFLAIGFLDSFRFLDRKKSMQLCFSIADRHFFLVGPVGLCHFAAIYDTCSCLLAELLNNRVNGFDVVHHILIPPKH